VTVTVFTASESSVEGVFV